MKNGLLVLGLFLCQFLSANNFTEYKQHIAKDRLILIFDKSVSAERKAEIIKSSGVVTSFTHLPSPAITICMTNDYDEALRFFKNQPRVKFVSFFLTDGQKNYAGVLNDFFVKLKDKNMQPLLSEKAKQLFLGKVEPDKYIPNLYKIENTWYENHSIEAQTLNGVTYTLPTPNTVDICAEFLAEDWCEYAAPNYLFNPLVNSNDPLYPRAWHLKNTGSNLQSNGTPGADMEVDSAWTLTTGDPNIKVGVIDSGVDTLQPDLVQNILPGHDAVSDSTDGYPTPAYPNDGHGTACSGIIAAVKDNNTGTAGVAPNCKIIPIRAFYYILLSGGSEPLPYATAASFSDAIGWACNTAGADILSNSWSLPSFLLGILPGGPQPVENAISNAYLTARNGKGIAMFFSSGNSGTSNGPLWPGPMMETITVNATNMCDSAVSSGDCSGADWAGDFGTGLDFAAPGVKVPTTDMRGSLGFSNNDNDLSFSGTSASCPNAAGIGALLLSLRPELGPEDIRNIMSQTCEKVGNYDYSTMLANGGWSTRLGYGRLNAYKALQRSFTYSGINETTAGYSLNVFPNPTTGVLNIFYNGRTGAVAKLYTVTGAEVLQTTLNNGVNSVETSSLPSGIYLLKADAEGGTVTRKVTVVTR